MPQALRRALAMIAAATMLAACAGREPNPVDTVQMGDKTLDCETIQAEITSNNRRIRELAEEEGEKVAQNIVAGTVGAVLFFPALFLMDFQDAAGKEGAALSDRNSYLASLYSDRGCADPDA